ncbi:hypothetical protein ACPCUV_25210 [Streptomyces platensis]|uniref:hypothetical protein n=1 Tax=Streptomyces platensis TaxID=58346 RepID=UPI003C2E685A
MFPYVSTASAGRWTAGAAPAPVTGAQEVAVRLDQAGGRSAVLVGVAEPKPAGLGHRVGDHADGCCRDHGAGLLEHLGREVGGGRAAAQRAGQDLVELEQGARCDRVFGGGQARIRCRPATSAVISSAVNSSGGILTPGASR